MKQVIFLVGFMGAGKSLLGKELAKKMQFSFLDSDEEIEKRMGLTVEQIFEKYGEEEFRKIETEWLGNLKTDCTIVSLGGGTPCYNGNMHMIRSLGQSVYLECTPEVLADRLAKAKTPRPLIAGYKNNPESLLEFIRLKLTGREKYYRFSNYIIDGSAEVNTSVKQLLKVFKY